MTEQLTTDRAADRARLRTQAGAIVTTASILGFGVALYQTWGNDFWIVMRDLAPPVASGAPAMAFVMIAAEDHGLTTRTSRAATFLVFSGGMALFIFAILAFFI